MSACVIIQQWLKNVCALFVQNYKKINYIPNNNYTKLAPLNQIHYFYLLASLKI